MAARSYRQILAFHYIAILGSLVLIFGDWFDSRSSLAKWLAAGFTLSLFLTYSRETKDAKRKQTFLVIAAAVFALALIASLRFSQPQIPPVWAPTGVASRHD